MDHAENNAEMEVSDTERIVSLSDREEHGTPTDAQAHIARVRANTTPTLLVGNGVMP